MAQFSAKRKVQSAKLRSEISSFKFMKNVILLLQIGDLFQGNLNWRGLVQLFLFILMGAVIIGVAGFTGYKAFSKPKKKDDVRK